MALDDTSAAGGTAEFARGSHRWPHQDDPTGEFHAPQDHRATVAEAAARHDAVLDIVPVEVGAGGGSFHHGWTWHGSGPNDSGTDRRVLVLHCASSESRFHRPGFDDGNGPIYSRYAHPDDDAMDEAHFPILWREDGYRTPGLPEPGSR
jgi:ectoine hydroxylase-related dioxygenase (phytanoyl-CoA dioxygenase family)